MITIHNNAAMATAMNWLNRKADDRKFYGEESTVSGPITEWRANHGNTTLSRSLALCSDTGLSINLNVLNVWRNHNGIR